MNKTKNTLPEQPLCPKCGGRAFLDRDSYGWYAQCLLCGHLQNIDQVSAAPAKTSGKINPQPRVMSR
jgi:hypothetical protein